MNKTKDNGTSGKIRVADVTSVISNMPNYYSYPDSLSDQAVKKHLGKIIEFREESRQVQT